MKKSSMTVDELKQFMRAHNLNNASLAKMLDVTVPAVDHWTTGRRPVPPTTAKLLRFFNLHVQLMDAFQ